MLRILLTIVATLSICAHARDLMRTPLLVEVPVVNQSTSYTCGPAAVAAALGYYGFDWKEGQLATEMRSDPQNGTALAAILKFVNSQKGMRAWLHTEVRIDELVTHLNQRQLAIIDLQAWRTDPNQPYRTAWMDGHYVLLIGVSGKNVYFMDPSLLGGYGLLPISEFLDRWHDLSDQWIPIYGTAIFLQGTPKPPPAWRKVE